eukprot:305117_1
MTDATFGVVGKDFVLFASDMNVNRSIMRMKDKEDKLYAVDKNKLIGWNGPQADSVNFCDYVHRNMELYKYTNHISLSNHAAASLVRNELAASIRTRSPYQTNVLFGGVDKSGPALYYIDYLGSMVKLNSAIHGYAAHMTLSLMDRDWRKNMSLDDAIALIKACVKQLGKRFIIGMPNFIFKVVDKDGIREVKVD